MHKFLWEWTWGPHAEALAAGRRVAPDVAYFALNPGDVVLVDEAGMAGTLNDPPRRLRWLTQCSSNRRSQVAQRGSPCPSELWNPTGHCDDVTRPTSDGPGDAAVCRTSNVYTRAH